MYIRADRAKQSPAEMWLGKHKVEQQPYLAYWLNRLITDWGGYIENKLAEYDEEGKRIHNLAGLLQSGSIATADDPDIYINPYANMTADERERLWNEQTAMVTMADSVHTVSS